MNLALAQHLRGSAEVVGQFALIPIDLAIGGLAVDLRQSHRRWSSRFRTTAVDPRQMRSRSWRWDGMTGFSSSSRMSRCQIKGTRNSPANSRHCVSRRSSKRSDQQRVDFIRPLPHQPHDHRFIGAMADTRGRQRTITALRYAALAPAFPVHARPRQTEPRHASGRRYGSWRGRLQS